MGEVLLAQGKEMREIKSNLAALSAQMAVMMEEVKKRGKGSAKKEKQVPTLQLPKGDCPAVPPPFLFSIWEVIPLYLLPSLPSIL
jgi:hypothetical protein